MKKVKSTLNIICFLSMTFFYLEVFGQEPSDGLIAEKGYSMIFRDDFDAVSGCNKSCYEGVLVEAEDINKIRTVTFEEVRQLEQDVLDQQKRDGNRGSQ